MEEGVATEMRGGPAGPDVTEVGWSLPCSLSSLLAMNCRARAEELTRRLQSRVKGGNNTHALERTSLVSPTTEGSYSMECRHSSLEDPNLDSLEEHNLRPIHVVTSEPTLHLRLPSPPANNQSEQDSDVYYDFDLASPDDVGEEVGEEHADDEKTVSHHTNGDRPESGCVTSVTSPLMFDEDVDEEGGEGDDNHLGIDHYGLQESVVCSPDADLRAVRHILSSSASIADRNNPQVNESHEQLGEYKRSSLRGTKEDHNKRFDERETEEEDNISFCERNDNDNKVISSHDDKKLDSDNEGEVNESDKIYDSDLSKYNECSRNAPEEGGVPCRNDGRRRLSEGATDSVSPDKWQKQYPHRRWSGQVATPVANSGSSWCHSARGTEPAHHLHSPPDSFSVTVVPGYSDHDTSAFEDNSEVQSSFRDDTCDAPGMNVNRTKGTRQRELPTHTQWVEVEDSERETRPTLTSSQQQHSEERLESDLPSPTDSKSLHHIPFEGELEEEVTITKSSVRDTTVHPWAISGTSSQLPAEDHLYVPSEDQPPVAAADMEARVGSEGDLHSKEELLDDDSDTEVIETLGEDGQGSDQEEENEEDIEEEVILTGKFRNIRQYTERVRRLSDDFEDQHPPIDTVKHEGEVLEDPGGLESTKSIDLADEDQISSSELASQLAQLDIEDEGVEEDLGDEDIDDEEQGESRSSSEEVDPARIEDYKMRIKRSSSLKCGKTPPGTPGRKKIVRFADVLGLDLAAVRTFLGGVPHVPRSAFWDLEVEKETNAAKTVSATAASGSAGIATCIPRRILTPLFQQPGSHPDFIDRVRHQKVVVENVVIGDDMSVRGVVRVLSLDFHKSVFVRYTFDQWRNYHEATATYVPNSHDGATDRFQFLLWGSFLQDNTALAFCVRYCTLGQEFWDNNYGRNYTMQCYTSLGISKMDGSSSPRPQNSSNVQQQMMAQGPQSASGSQGYPSFGSPVTPNDPWTTRFF